MKQKLKIDAEARDRIRQSWIWRALEAAREALKQDDPMFFVLQAALGLKPTAYPYYEKFGIIDEQGYIRTNIYRRDGTRDNAVRLFEAGELVDNLGRLADAINATDQERTQLFLKVRQWITHDDREGQANMAYDRLPGVKPLDRRKQ